MRRAGPGGARSMRLLVVIGWAMLGGGAHAQVVQHRDAATLPVELFEFPGNRVKVWVEATGSLKTTDMRPDEGVSIQDALKQLPAIADLGRRELLLVSGGRAGSRTDLPDGLLKSNGRLSSSTNLTKLRGSPAEDCALRRADRYRLSGLLCVRKDSGAVSIGKVTADIAGLAACEHAIQSGPLLVEEGKPAVCDRDPSEVRSTYSVFCTRADGTLAVAVARKPVAIDELAKWLAEPRPAGADCQSAMALNVGKASGAVYTGPKSFQVVARKPRYSGPGTVPVPSFVVIQPLGN